IAATARDTGSSIEVRAAGNPSSQTQARDPRVGEAGGEVGRLAHDVEAGAADVLLDERLHLAATEYDYAVCGNTCAVQ
ncbi:MAG TPA: hypothetical protein VGC93_05210, partial [Thermoanaerobaculia bacterium]